MKQIAFAICVLSVLVACGGNSTPGTVVAEPGSGNPGSGNPGNSINNVTNSNTDSSGINGNESTVSNGSTVTSLSVEHRSGQTFVVWNEMGSATGYHVYRHNSPITSGNLSSATRLTEKWGPLDVNTSVNRYGNDTTPQNFVIKDLANPLGDNQGLFVHTTQNNEQGGAYYAVTSVLGSSENRSIVSGSNTTTQPVNEFFATPRPVLSVSVNSGKGRVYTQYMDYAKWNPTLKGYAFDFGVALPQNYNGSRSYPLMVELHAFGESHKFVDQSEFDWEVIQIFPNDPGEIVGTSHTWWYGFAADHNYKTQGSFPRSGVVENYTEQRVVAAVKFLINDGQFNIDRELVHIYGNSMGASGAVSFGMRYPSLFAGAYASQPMMNYGASPIFQDNFVRIWGTQADNLPIVNSGPNVSDISRYGQGGAQATQVYNWMNHFEQIERRRADRFAYLMVDHGKEDGTIDWATQGAPVVSAFTTARVGFSAAAVGGVGHSWLGFESVVHAMFGLGSGDLFAWRYPRSLSFPGIHFASNSGPVRPGATGTDLYNTNIEWATPKNNFHQGIVDNPNRYEISIRSMAGAQTAHITPRNTRSFKPGSGAQCNWTAKSNNNNSTIGSGNVTADGNRLVTIAAVPIATGNGTRLSINCR